MAVTATAPNNVSEFVGTSILARRAAWEASGDATHGFWTNQAPDIALDFQGTSKV